MPRPLARELDQTALADRAEEAKASMTIALQAFDAGNTGKALAAARKAKDAAPRSRSVREALGLILHARGQFKDAIAELQAFRRMSGSPIQDPVIAECYRSIGRHDKALEVLTGLDQYSLDEAAWIDSQITRARAHEDRGSSEAAFGVLRMAEDAPNISENQRLQIRYALAEMLERNGRRDEARAMFARIAVKFPSYRDVVDRARALAK